MEESVRAEEVVGAATDLETKGRKDAPVGLADQLKLRAWIIYLEIGILATVSFLLINPLRGSRPLFEIMGVASAAAILVSVHLHRPERPLAWHLFGLALLMFVLGNLIKENYPWLFGSSLPFPSLADIPTLVVRGLLIGGLMILFRRRNPAGDVAGFIDSIIIAGGLGLFCWVILVGRLEVTDVSLAGKLTSLIYPMLDVALLSVVARLTVGGGRRNASFYLLVAGTFTLLVTDVLYGFSQLDHGVRFGLSAEAGWLAFYLLWATAALHPSMAVLDEPTEVEIRDRGYRFVLLGVAALTGPALMMYQALQGRVSDPGVLASGSALLLIFVLVRLRGLMVDVAERKAAESALRSSLAREQELVDRLKELDRMKSDFVSSVSHELRTPLTSIMGYMELMDTEEDEPLGPTQDDYLKVIGRNAQRLLNLIEDLLTLSRIESGVFRVELKPVAVADLVAGANEAVMPALAGRNLQLVTQISDQLATVSGDAGKLERALLNLLSNAIKFTPDGGTITIAALERGEFIEFSVADTGMGIPAQEQDALFTRFFRSSISQEKAIQGTGLGLTIVKTIVEQHGGTVGLESEPGTGTKVTFTIPRTEGRDKQPVGHAPERKEVN
ncbi:MAG: sensor histidine kinase [Actinomycetota bacterium]